MFEVINLLADLLDWFFVGIYDLITEAFAYAIEWFMIAKIKFQIFMVQFTWDVAANILNNIGLSELINSAWSSIDSTALGYFTFFRLPEALSIVLQAYVTKFTLKALL